MSAIRFGANRPFWYLSYEATYYPLFGNAAFTKGLIAPVLITNPAVLLLPIRLAGIVVYNGSPKPPQHRR